MGARLALLFLATVAVAVALAPRGGGSGAAVAAVEVAVAVCLGALAYVLVRRLATGWLLVAVAGAALVGGLLANSSALDVRSSQQILAWALSGVAGGVALSRGPVWGLAAFLVTTTAYLAEQPSGAPAPLMAVLGALTFYTGGALTHTLAHRGFATTERELVASESAAAAQEIEQERWRARLHADRQLHDTVLATLTLLAHRGVGLTDRQIRDACQRDLVALNGDVSALVDESSAVISTSAAPVEAESRAIEDVVRLVTSRAATIGIDMRVHGDDTALATATVAPLVAVAVSEALFECVENVRRHAGVAVLDVMVTVSEGGLVLVALDEGQGFDLSAVADDRLGLRASVRDRIAGVAGSTTIWSRPGQGTSVMLRVPLLRATAVVDSAAPAAASQGEDA
jgi:signal transduction histidine kinase